MKKIVIFLLALCLLFTGCVTQPAENTPSAEQTATPMIIGSLPEQFEEKIFSSVEAVEKLIAILEGDTSLGTLEEGKDGRHNITFEADGETYTLDYELMQSAYGNRLKIFGFPRPADGTELENFSLTLIMPNNWEYLAFEYSVSFSLGEDREYLFNYDNAKSNIKDDHKYEYTAEVNGNKLNFRPAVLYEPDGSGYDQYRSEQFYYKGAYVEISVFLPSGQPFSGTDVTNDLKNVIF